MMSDPVGIFRIATRMFLNVLKVFDEHKEDEAEIGCKCKETEVASQLYDFLLRSLKDLPVEVALKEEGLVVSVLIHPVKPPAKVDDAPDNSPPHARTEPGDSVAPEA